MFRKLLYFVFVMSMLFVLTGCWENSLLDRSLIFSTHTTLGLEIAVSPAETSSPAKILIGYKRTEGVINPVYHSKGITPAKKEETTQDSAGKKTITTENGAARYRPEAYSVIAKIHGEVGAKAADTAEGTMSVAQWFATGQAAKILAGQPGIAGAVSGSSEIGEAAAREARFAAKLEGLNEDYAFMALGIIYKALKELPKDDTKAEEYVSKLDKIANTITSGIYRSYDFDDTASPKVLNESIADAETTGLDGLISLHAGLETSKKNLAKALDTSSFNLTTNGATTPVNKGHEQYKRLTEILTQQQGRFENINNKLKNDETVIEAVQYYFSLIMN